jgi:hypothetical protein
MPFDAIMLQYQIEGLCPPGLGLIQYDPMSKALIKSFLSLFLALPPLKSMPHLLRFAMNPAMGTTISGASWS